MDKKRLIVSIVIVLIALLLNLYVLKYLSIGDNENASSELQMTVVSDYADSFSAYYSQINDFSEDRVSAQNVGTAGTPEDISFTVKPEAWIRLDFGVGEGNIIIEKLKMSMYGVSVDLMDYLADEGCVELLNCIDDYSVHEENGKKQVVLHSSGEDPYIIFQVDAETAYSAFEKEFENKNMVKRLVFVALIDIIVALVLVHLREYASVPLEIARNRRLVVSLSKNDFKTRFAGSYLGTIWAFVQPIVTVLVYWFVFEKGLRAGRVSEYPFVLWLMAGLIPWFYFSEALSGGANALTEYNYLVKKVVFHISILPVVKVVSSLFVHIFFTAFVFVLCWCYGYGPDLYSLQLFYYILAGFMLVLGLAYLNSSIACFFKDMTQIINIVLQVGIWMTPIMWQTSILSPALARVFKLNPVYYIVQGFRDALLEKQWFWNDMAWTIYFWVFVIALFLFSTRIFQKLKVHFADVL